MISSFGYSLKQGFKNIGRNMLFSLAPISCPIAWIWVSSSPWSKNTVIPTVVSAAMVLWRTFPTIA